MDAAAKTAGSGAGSDDRDPVVSCLLNAAEAWMMLSRTATLGKEKVPDRSGNASLLLATPASAAGQSDTSSGRRGSVQSGRRSRRKTRGSSRSSSNSKRGEWVGTASGRRGGAPEEQDQPAFQQASSGGGEGGGGGRPLAAATATPLRRRELFYHLVDAFRDYQTRRRTQQSTTASGGTVVDEQGVLSREKRAEGNGGGSGLPLIGTSCGGGGGDSAAASVSDNFSVSVRTLCDFGPPECRNASTQTIAKVGEFLLRCPGRCLCCLQWPRRPAMISTACFNRLCYRGSTWDSCRKSFFRTPSVEYHRPTLCQDSNKNIYSEGACSISSLSLPSFSLWLVCRNLSGSAVARHNDDRDCSRPRHKLTYHRVLFDTARCPCALFCPPSLSLFLLAALPGEIRFGQASTEVGGQQHVPYVQQHRDQQRLLRQHSAQQLGLRHGPLGQLN